MPYYVKHIYAVRDDAGALSDIIVSTGCKNTAQGGHDGPHIGHDSHAHGSVWDGMSAVQRRDFFDLLVHFEEQMGVG